MYLRMRSYTHGAYVTSFRSFTLPYVTVTTEIFKAAHRHLSRILHTGTVGIHINLWLHTVTLKIGDWRLDI